MPQGLQTWNSAGDLTLDTNYDVGRVLGITSITSSAGSVTDAGLTTGRPFWWYMKDDGGSFSTQPDISVSGSTLSWSWPSGGGSNGRILYGVY
jgi:hypothetical protein